jgi:hypothetical protein
VLILNADRATVDPAKLRNYLLSATHPIGRFKARFFAALGFTPDRWEELVEALRIQHLTQDGQLARPTDEGQKYTIRAILNGPTGQSAVVISVWFIPAGGDVRAAIRDRISGRWLVSFHALDVVVLNTDLPAQGLKRGDLGAVVDVYSPDAIEVEFVTASGRTQALITLQPSDIREVGDDDLVAVRPAGTSPGRRDA